MLLFTSYPQDPNEELTATAHMNNAAAAAASTDQKGFYIAFDNAQPKRPKPPLRTKRSPKKERSVDQPDDRAASSSTSADSIPLQTQHQPLNRTHSQQSQYGHSSGNSHQHDATEDHMQSISAKHYTQQSADAPPAHHRRSVSANHHLAEAAAAMAAAQPEQLRHLEDLTNRRLVSQLQPQTHAHHQLDNAGRAKENKLIIDDAAVQQQLDPDSVEEMERKKEKIMLLSLQRRQQQEEAKARKEVDAMQRREREQNKTEERERKREQQQARRAAILEQHKFKKAIEEAEQKGLTIDRNDLMVMKQQLASVTAAAGGAGGGGGGAGPSSAKMRPNRVVRPRPKTIHVESGSVDMGGGGEGPSGLARHKGKGSNTNLTGACFVKELSVFVVHSLLMNSFCFCFLLFFCVLTNEITSSVLGLHLGLGWVRLFVRCCCTAGVGQLSSGSMRRDYYRGSQDSLAIRGMFLFRYDYVRF